MKIGIVGSGTASAVSLLKIFEQLEKHQCKHVDVFCIYDPNIPITTVGESTSSLLPILLYNVANFSITEEMQHFDGTLRWGTRYYWKDANDTEFFVKNGIPGLHVNSEKFSRFVINRLDEIYENFSQIHGNVSSMTQDAYKVTAVIDDVEHKFDFLIDCRGNPTEEELNSGAYSFPQFETVNSVILYPDFKEYNEDITSAYVHEDGWMFGVPLTHRKAFGYLYNKNFTSHEEASEKFAKLKGIDTINLRRFSWRQYYKNTAMDGRIMSMGNRLQFFEPAQALPLHYYINLTMEFISRIINNNLDVHKMNIQLNFDHRKNIEGMQNLIALNYCGSCNIKSPFWEYATINSRKRLKNSQQFQQYLRDCEKSEKIEIYWWHNAQLMKEYIDGFGIKLDQLSQKQSAT